MKASMKSIRKRSFGFLFFFLLVGSLTICLCWNNSFNASATEKEPTTASGLKTPEDVLDYIVSNPENVSLVAYDIDDVDNGIYLNPDVKRPLASTVKILVLAEYARQVEEKMILPDELISLSDVDVYYLPGTDSGAHQNAIKEFQQKGFITSEKRIALKHIVRAMMVQSDNAATDYLIEKLGRENIERIPTRIGISNQDAPLPISGIYLSWINKSISASPEERLEKYKAMSHADYADVVYSLAFKLKNDKSFRSRMSKHISIAFMELKPETQIAMAQALSPLGTARGYAELLTNIYNGRLISPQVSKTMREYLEWLMEIPGFKDVYDAFGIKGGNLPGVLTEALYAKRRNAKSCRIVVLFFNSLPNDIYSDMTGTFIHQKFWDATLKDDLFFQNVRKRVIDSGHREK